MGTISNFTDLDIWKRAHELTMVVYKLVGQFPASERYALSDQLRRAVVSIESNIAEGFARYGKLEKRQFYYIARGSLSEVNCQLIIARDLGFLSQLQYDQANTLIVDTGRMFTAIIKRIQTW